MTCISCEVIVRVVDISGIDVHHFHSTVFQNEHSIYVCKHTDADNYKTSFMCRHNYDGIISL